MDSFSHNLAIAIGINNYCNNIAELKTARPDAEKLANLLGTDYNYQVELTTDNTPHKPTLKELRTLLTRWLPQQLQPPAHNNRLLFYFAGHGMSLESDDGPKGFLLPQDADPKDPSTFLPMQELHDALIALPCHHLLIILDCCFAGTFRWSSTRKSIPIPETIHRQHYDRFLRYPACQVITSSAHNQEALDFLSDKRGTGKDAQHSPFAEALFEALQDGKPDEKGKRYKKADLTKDGVITAPELYLYLRDNVETRSGERQTPGLFPLKKHDRGEYIFHDPKFDPSTLSEAPELDEANNPYRGLKPFEEEHARFFFGRQELIERLYARIAAPEHSLTVVLGISGSGKSSLVKAGLIPYLKQRSLPEEFATHLAKACILTSAILRSFARLPHKSWFPPRFLPIDYIHQWQILAPLRPGESPFASLARTLLAIVDTSPDTAVSTQLKQLDFVSRLLENRLEQLDTQIDQLVTQGKANSSKSKQLQREVETFTQLIEDWNDASLSIRQRSLVEHFEMLYSLCQTGNQETEQQQQLKQAFQDCLAPLVKQLQPDSRSLVAIVQSWSKNYPDTKLLLIIDQFEELITLGRTTQQNAKPEQIEEWQKFLNLLEKTLAADLNELCIIVTLRSDFEPRFLSSEALKPYWSKARFPVRAMRLDELRQAIEGPTSEVALYFEPANLVDRLIDEVGQMPGALPLLSFTLSELYVKLAHKWRNKETSDRALTIDDQFNQEGGVAGSLTRRANEEYQKIGEDPNLGEKGQHTMRRIMLRMLTLEGGETARRRVPDSELIYPIPEESDRVKQVVNRLVNARLLVRGQLETGEPYVEPAHDFLVRGWGMLQDWINEEKAKETLELQQRLTAQANDWNRSNRPDGLLLPDGDRLSQLEEMLKISDNNTPDNFLNGFTRPSGLAVPRSSYFIKVSSTPDFDNKILSTAESGFEAQNLLKFCPEYCDNWLNHKETEFIENSIKYRESERARVKNLQVKGELRQEAANVLDLLTVKPVDGLILAIQTAGQNQEELPGEILTEVQASLHRAMETVTAESYFQKSDFYGSSDLLGIDIYKVIFSPNGQKIASRSIGQEVRLWNLKGQLISRPFRPKDDGVISISFDCDSQLLIASCRKDGSVCLWNLQGEPISQPFAEENNISCISFSPDGQKIVTLGRDMTMCLWRLQGSIVQQLFRKQVEVFGHISFTPNGQRIAIEYGTELNKELLLLDLLGNPSSRPFQGHDDIRSIAFSSDGRMIVSGGQDNILRLWNLEGEQIGEPFIGHTEPISSVAFSPDSQKIVSASFDDTLRLWDLKGNLIGPSLKTNKYAAAYSVAFSPNGKVIVSGGGGGEIRFWGVDWQRSLQICCEHLNTLMICSNPTTEVEQAACKTCQTLVWSRAENAQILINQGRSEVQNGNIEGAIAKFHEAKGLDPTLDLNPEIEAGRLTAEILLAQGEELARQVDVQGAIEKMYKALELDPTLVELYAVFSDSDLLKAEIQKTAASTLIEQGRDLAKQEDIEGAIAKFHEAKGLDPTLDLNPETEAGRLTAEILLAQGEELARQVDVQGAIEKMYKALELDPTLVELYAVFSDSDLLKAEIQKTAASTLIEQGRDLAKQEDIEGAIAKFHEAKGLDPTLDLNPETEAGRLTAPNLIEKGEEFAQKGSLEAAIKAYRQALEFDPNLEVSASTWNSLCWYGSLYGYARVPDVMAACEKAVESEFKSGTKLEANARWRNYADMRNSRGVARAMTDNIEGAIEDFQIYAICKGNLEERAQRLRWIAALRSGENPFTPEEIKKLLKE